MPGGCQESKKNNANFIYEDHFSKQILKERGRENTFSLFSLLTGRYVYKGVGNKGVASEHLVFQQFLQLQIQLSSISKLKDQR